MGEYTSKQCPRARTHAHTHTRTHTHSEEFLTRHESKLAGWVKAAAKANSAEAIHALVSQSHTEDLQDPWHPVALARKAAQALGPEVSARKRQRARERKSARTRSSEGGSGPGEGGSGGAGGEGREGRVGREGGRGDALGL